MKQNLRVAIYASVSTDVKGQDPLNQLLQLREFAVKQGWTVVAEYTDEVTAQNGHRTGFKRMWKDAAGHRFDVVLFWSLDRLTREGTLATLTYLRRLKDHYVLQTSYEDKYFSMLKFRERFLPASLKLFTLLDYSVARIRIRILRRIGFAAPVSLFR
jgi:DNA invertase Pin-like site-specific DNA recombinase